MGAARKIEPPTARDTLRFHLGELERQLAFGEDFMPLMLHDIEGAIAAFRRMEREERECSSED